MQDGTNGGHTMEQEYLSDWEYETMHSGNDAEADDYEEEQEETE